MADLFHYLDYRHFLKDYYREQKEKKRSTFSFRSFSRLAGFSSPNFLKLVMEGKRNLGPEGVVGFSKALKLGKEEGAFFSSLVQFNQAGNDEERNKFYAQLAKSKKFREIKEIEHAHFEYFSKWYYAAIRELVMLPDFREDPDWIARKVCPAILPKDAKRALELLQQLGFLKRDGRGKLIQSERNIKTAPEVRSLAVSNFHRQMMGHASHSIERTKSHWRDISSLTVALSEKKFREAKRRIQEFRQELNVLLSEDNEVEAVYQLNFQIFNLSEVPWKSRSTRASKRGGRHGMS